MFCLKTDFKVSEFSDEEDSAREVKKKCGKEKFLVDFSGKDMKLKSEER